MMYLTTVIRVMHVILVDVKYVNFTGMSLVSRAFPLAWRRVGTSSATGRTVLPFEWLHEFINLCKMLENLKWFYYKFVL